VGASDDDDLSSPQWAERVERPWDLALDVDDPGEPRSEATLEFDGKV
jgi:hypothetical protein